ncbi:MAG: hypothetical protein LBI49_04905, partial [Nocardiopsaceae bacterium]|nr:hypothetical protein [Nocardiopsaceae bacterium]
AAAGPGSSYFVLVTPMVMVGAGLGLAIPALTRAVTSTVPPADIGTASGAFSTTRQLGGAFGVAVLGAAFAATGSYDAPGDFSHGFVTASAVAAGLALAGTVAGTILPGRGKPSSPVAPPAAGRGSSAGRAAGVSRPASSSAHAR